jgi:hypothetical protein
MNTRAKAGLVLTYVCATVGTMSSNAVDPVGAIADVAYADSACICSEFRHHLDGVERADLISLSPHKWLLTHYRKLLNFHRPMEDKPKPTEEAFFRRLHLIFRRSLADGSY